MSIDSKKESKTLDSEIKSEIKTEEIFVGDVDVADDVDENVSESVVEDVQEVSRGEYERIPMSLPSQTSGEFKTYMSYKAITDTSSDQWKLQQQAYTDSDGFRKVGNDFCVAIGQHYSKTVGDRFHIKLDSGIEFTAIVGDIKQQQHTDSTNRYVEQNGSILEFIVATKYVDDKTKVMGDMSYSNLQGGILSIEKVVE